MPLHQVLPKQGHRQVVEPLLDANDNDRHVHLSDEISRSGQGYPETGWRPALLDYSATSARRRCFSDPSVDVTALDPMVSVDEQLGLSEGSLIMGKNAERVNGDG